MVHRSVLAALLSVVTLIGFSLHPNQSFAQGDKAEKLQELKQSYKSGLQAAKAENHTQAYKDLERALSLSKETEMGGVEEQVMKYLTKLPKNWGNEAIKNENYEEALTHFQMGAKHAENDAYMHYGKGLALINLDSSKAGIEALQQAVKVGNETGNTRVTKLATERIEKKRSEGKEETETRQQTSGSSDWKTVKRFEGRGQKNTAPFTIDSDMWVISYNAESTTGGSTGHIFQVYVQKPSDDSFTEVAANSTNARQMQDASYIYEQGTFYLKVNAANSRWVIEVKVPADK